MPPRLAVYLLLQFELALAQQELLDLALESEVLVLDAVFVLAELADRLVQLLRCLLVDALVLDHLLLLAMLELAHLVSLTLNQGLRARRNAHN